MRATESSTTDTRARAVAGTETRRTPAADASPATTVLHDVRQTDGPRPVPDVGVVVIGRNEGERLRRCLRSVAGAARRVVYVDSGSTDGSREAAHTLGADVVELDQRVPFTPGRARNAGFGRLLELEPNLAYVQFIDGDCELVTGWLDKGSAFLRGHAEFAVAAGRRRERDPSRSVYNMLCAAEWDTHPRGESKSCGGDSMMRTDVFARLGGYRDDLMAGEEPELCIRMRTSGWRIWLLADEMTVHDAAMIRFGQWWRRAMRSGYGAVQGAWLFGAAPQYHCVRALASAGFWALGLPAGALLLATVWSPWFLFLLAAYAVQVVRLARSSARRRRDSWFEALFLVLSRFPQLVGQAKCVAHMCLRRQGRLIDYKSVR